VIQPKPVAGSYSRKNGQAMKQGTTFLALMLGISLATFAQKQATFTVKLSNDSILMGNPFQVTFTLENGRGQNFQAPAFTDFDVVGGPNQSSSFSMINGEVTQSLSYSYWLEARKPGNYYVEPASVDVDGRTLETLPASVIVIPNPDGIKQNPLKENPPGRLFWDFDDQFTLPVPPPPVPADPPAPKRKTYRL
jgi:hypothetical protein